MAIRPPLKTVAAACVLAMLTVAGGAEAARYSRSQHPYWHVGRLDPTLSEACQRSQFNQIHDQRYHIGFTGENGQGTVGFAQLGWNLRDPGGLARPGVTYHFYNDGHSNCTVFVAGE